MRPEISDINYCIFDPTGNITALVETAVDPAYQPALASRIMELHPEVEQVGFVTYSAAGADGQRGSVDACVPVSLRMAGGEFCGNATMCAAALYAVRSGLPGGAVAIKVSGASAPLTVSLERQAAASFSAAVEMPPALKIGALKLQPSSAETEAGAFESCPPAILSADEAGGLKDVGAAGVSAYLSLPIVEMEGISHIIVEPDSGFFGIKDDSALAESLLKQWCGALGSDCLGMMFLGGESEPCGTESSCRARAESQSNGSCNAAAGDARSGIAKDADTRIGNPGIACERALTPLVYVPGADTMFWENSCASGSAAAGMYLAAKAGSPVDVTFDEPAGQLRVESDPRSGKTILHGSVILRPFR